MKNNSNLWKPLKIGKLEAQNRFAVLPMECADADENGGLSPDALARYDRYCEGGSSLIFMEAITLQYETRSRAMQLLLDIHDPASVARWSKFIKDLKAKYPDKIVIFQYHHAGEVAGRSFSRRVSVKNLYGFGGDVIDEQYIDNYIDLQVETAKVLYDMGFDGIDLKMCHGYLGSQLVRPYNDREWKYGGSWENRSRFAFESCERIRKAIPDEKFLIGARVSMFEEMPGGQGHVGMDSPYIDLSESIALIQGMEERGCAYFGETIGNASLFWEYMSPTPSCSVNVYNHMTMSKLMKDNLKKDTVVIGAGMSVLGDGTQNQLRGVDPKINNFEHWANYCIETGGFDMVGLGRQAMADPYLPNKIKGNNDDAINWCKTCNLCSELEVRMEHIGCVVYNKKYADLLKKVRAQHGVLERIVTGDE